MRLFITRTDDAPDLPLPAYMSEGAAGMDLRANVFEPVSVGRGEIKLIPTGIKIALPFGYEAQIRPRSGLSLKGVSMPNSPGTIDSDYRGEIKVPIINFGEEPFTIRRGDRIGQMVINKVEIAELEILGNFDGLPATERGEGGYGSTG